MSLQPCTQACIWSCLLLPLQAALVVQVQQDQGGGALLKVYSSEGLDLKEILRGGEGKYI